MALPTRTCVAPAGHGGLQVLAHARGHPGRGRVGGPQLGGQGREPGERGPRVLPSGATAISPRRRSDSEPATASARAAARSVPRHRARPPGLLVQVDLDQHVTAPGRPGAPRRPARRPAGAGRPSAPRAAYDATEPALFVCSCPTKCQRRSDRSAHSAAFAAASWSRFSPTSRTPSACRARTSDAGNVFVTTTTVTSAGSRPAATAARATRSRTADRPVGHLGDPGRVVGLGHDVSRTTPANRPVVPSRR